MKGQNEQIRQFLSMYDWATPENIAYLLYGKNTTAKRNDAAWILTSLSRCKNRKKRIKILPNEYEKVYALYSNPKHSKGSYNLVHDVMLRNVLAVLKADFGKTNRLGPDAELRKGDDLFYLELDTGHEDGDFLRGKIMSNYLQEGNYRVIFIMAARPGEKESTRIDKLFEIVKTTLPKKRGRVLAACYSQYLTGGQVYTMAR